ncbi:MAG TPA: permease, partial [Thermoanaerobaculia bacterium]
AAWQRRLLGLAAAGAAVLLYTQLRRIASWLTYEAAGLDRGGSIGAAVEFFVFEAPKVLLLLTAVVFVVGVLRSVFTPERARRLLAGRREASGNVLAALFGVATPFCSCSAVPLSIGLVKEESYERMMALGLLATPGVAIDGKVVMSGRIPKADEVRRLLGIGS